MKIRHLPWMANRSEPFWSVIPQQDSLISKVCAPTFGTHNDFKKKMKYQSMGPVYTKPLKFEWLSPLLTSQQKRQRVARLTFDSGSSWGTCSLGYHQGDFPGRWSSPTCSSHIKHNKDSYESYIDTWYPLPDASNSSRASSCQWFHESWSLNNQRFRDTTACPFMSCVRSSTSHLAVVQKKW